jgi:hypothetical protein
MLKQQCGDGPPQSHLCEKWGLADEKLPHTRRLSLCRKPFATALQRDRSPVASTIPKYEEF